jgi:hypothetical protein
VGVILQRIDHKVLWDRDETHYATEAAPARTRHTV